MHPASRRQIRVVCGRGRNPTFSPPASRTSGSGCEDLLALLPQLALRADVPVERYRPDAELAAQRGHRRVVCAIAALGQPHLSSEHAAAGRRSWCRSAPPLAAEHQGGEQALPCNPSSSTGRATLPEPHPPDADQGGPDRARERRGPRCIRSVRRGPRAGLPARRFGGVPPPSSPLLTPCQVERLACTHSRPIRPRSGSRPTRSERRLRRRGGRRPRPDLERRSGLHPEAVKGDGHGMGGEPLPLRRRTRPA